MEHVAKFGGDLRHKAARRKRKRIQQQNEWIDGHNNFGLEWLSISTEQIYADYSYICFVIDLELRIKKPASIRILAYLPEV